MNVVPFVGRGGGVVVGRRIVGVMKEVMGGNGFVVIVTIGSVKIGLG